VELPSPSGVDVAALWAAIWPALGIALLRIGDVTLNVFRMVFVVQERRLLAALASAGEASMWLSAAGIVFANMTPVRAVGYVAGVAAGTAIGMEVAKRLRLGMATVRVYADATRTDDYGVPLEMGHRIATAIREAGYAATVFRGHGLRGEVDMVLATVRRRNAEEVVKLARGVDESAMAAIDNSLNPAAVPAGTSGRA
jgi:uncharacterized protein YebE (UPF0316 family)